MMSRALIALALLVSVAHADGERPRSDVEQACDGLDPGDRCVDDQHACVRTQCRHGQDVYGCMICDPGTPAQVHRARASHTGLFVGGVVAAAAVLGGIGFVVGRRRRGRPAHDVD
jgi:hypothetical protein